MRFCRECGLSMSDTAEFCPTCGTRPLAEPASAAEAQPSGASPETAPPDHGPASSGPVVVPAQSASSGPVSQTQGPSERAGVPKTATAARSRRLPPRSILWAGAVLVVAVVAAVALLLFTHHKPSPVDAFNGSWHEIGGKSTLVLQRQGSSFSVKEDLYESGGSSGVEWTMPYTYSDGKLALRITLGGMIGTTTLAFEGDHDHLAMGETANAKLWHFQRVSGKAAQSSPKPSATAPTTTAAIMTRYTNARYGFSIGYPSIFESWTPSAKPAGSLFWVGWATPTLSGLRPTGSCNVTVYRQNPGVTQAMIDKSARDTLAEDRRYVASGKPVPGFTGMTVTFTKAEMRTLAGQKWLYVAATETVNGEKRFDQTCTFESTSIMYVIGLYADEGEFRSWHGATLFDQIAQSFRFVK